MRREFASQGFGILQRGGGFHPVLGTNPTLDNFIERRGAVRSLPNDGGGLVEREKSRILAGHDHHFAVEVSRRYPRIARYIKPGHPIISHTRASGMKVSLETGTRLTNSQAA